MMIYPKVAEAVQGNSFTSGGNPFQFRDPEERSTKSVVRVKDGETVVIGGLIRNEMQRQETKVPVLGNLPIIGALFRHTGGTSDNPDKNRERELLVFITPHIIKDADTNVKASANTNIEIAKAKNNVLPGREQDANSGASRSNSINSVLNNFEREK